MLFFIEDCEFVNSGRDTRYSNFGMAAHASSPSRMLAKCTLFPHRERTFNCPFINQYTSRKERVWPPPFPTMLFKFMYTGMVRLVPTTDGDGDGDGDNDIN